jgi:hypothetical protein
VAFIIEPYTKVVPYSNVTVVLLPFGLTDPFKVAVVLVTDVAAEEVAAGATRFASVVNDRSDPRTVPAAFTAFTLK